MLIIGVAVAYQAAALGLYSHGEVGTGFFPFCCGVGLAAMSVVQIARPADATSGDELPGSDGRVLRWLVLAAIVLFALLVERFGLAVASFVSVAVSCLAVKRKLIETLALSAILSIAAVVIFVVLLKAPVQF